MQFLTKNCQVGNFSIVYFFYNIQECNTMWHCKFISDKMQQRKCYMDEWNCIAFFCMYMILWKINKKSWVPCRLSKALQNEMRIYVVKFFNSFPGLSSYLLFLYEILYKKNYFSLKLLYMVNATRQSLISLI